MMRLNAVLAGGSIALAAGAIAVACLAWLQPQPAATPAPSATGTTEITRGPLRDTRTVTGTLGYGDLSTLRAAGPDAHMLTWLAPVGDTVNRGQPVYRLEGLPTVLFYGTQPQSRTLRFDPGSTSPVWVELEAAADAVTSAELALDLEQQRLADADARLADIHARLADAGAPTPASSEMVQLKGAIDAAADRLERLRDLVAAQLAPAAELAPAVATLASARAALDAAQRTLQRDAAGARLDAATARVAIADATAKRDALRLAHEALAARAGDNTDVRQLAENLAALGYAGSLPDQVRAWQRDVGLPATGIVEPGQLLVAPGPIHIAAHRSGVGEAVAASSSEGGAILDYSSTLKLVTVPLAVADQALASPGRAVVIILPDDARIDGTIAAIGSIVTDGTIDISVAIADQAALAALEIAAVDVEFVSASRADVLSVPVTALLARPEGGFAVEIVEVEAGATHLTAVETGLFGSGRVEISGDGIAEGVRVSVPR